MPLVLVLRFDIHHLGSHVQGGNVQTLKLSPATQTNSITPEDGTYLSVGHHSLHEQEPCPREKDCP